MLSLAQAVHTRQGKADSIHAAPLENDSNMNIIVFGVAEWWLLLMLELFRFFFFLLFGRCSAIILLLFNNYRMPRPYSYTISVCCMPYGGRLMYIRKWFPVTRHTVLAYFGKILEPACSACALYAHRSRQQVPGATHAFKIHTEHKTQTCTLNI